MSALLETLKQQAKSLIYTSEADFAVKPFVWDKEKTGDGTLTPEKIKTILNLAANAPVETVTYDEFFAPVVALEDWYGEEETQTAKQFQTLADTLKTSLTDITVYKIGDAKKTVVVVGKAADGTFAGVTTKVVET
jgi:hypothetical protein